MQIGEVSTENDGKAVNVFNESVGRFANAEEDVVSTHLLVSD